MQLRKFADPDDHPSAEQASEEPACARTIRTFRRSAARVTAGPPWAARDHASQRPVVDGSHHLRPAGREGCGQYSGASSRLAPLLNFYSRRRSRMLSSRCVQTVTAASITNWNQFLKRAPLATFIYAKHARLDFPGPSPHFAFKCGGPGC